MQKWKRHEQSSAQLPRWMEELTNVGPETENLITKLH